MDPRWRNSIRRAVRLSKKLLGQIYVKEGLKSFTRKNLVGTVSYQTIWGPSFSNVARHSGWWPSTVTDSINRDITRILDPVNDLDLITEFNFLPNSGRFPLSISNGCGMPTEDAYSPGHMVLSLFGTCIYPNVETNLSRTSLVSGLLSFEHPSVLLFYRYVQSSS